MNTRQVTALLKMPGLHCASLIFALMAVAQLALGQQISRADALAGLDRDIGKIRLEMNPSPIDASQRLLDLATAAGDDPRVIEICAEVIRTSTNTISRRGAVDALKAALTLHGISIRLHRRTAAIAHAFEPALTAKDTQLRLEAIAGYVSVGSRQKAEKLYSQAFRDTPASVDDETRGELIRSIRQLIGTKDADLNRAIKQAVARAGLIAFVKDRTGDPILAGSKMEDQKLLQQLEDLEKDR